VTNFPFDSHLSFSAMPVRFYNSIVTIFMLAIFATLATGWVVKPGIDNVDSLPLLYGKRLGTRDELVFVLLCL
jgi:hypothetical protein